MQARIAATQLADVEFVAHVHAIARRVRHPLILWDNYPVNDLSMSDELHIGPLRGRDALLPQVVYGYLNNPLLQEELGFLPLATCLDFARQPSAYHPEASWSRAVKQCFGAAALAQWQTIREFCESSQRTKRSKGPARRTSIERARLRAVLRYLAQHRKEKWGIELKVWRKLIQKALG